MEDDQNGRCPQWKTTSIEDNLANFVFSFAQLSPKFMTYNKVFHSVIDVVQDRWGSKPK